MCLTQSVCRGWEDRKKSLQKGKLRDTSHIKLERRRCLGEGKKDNGEKIIQEGGATTTKD